MYAGYAGKHRTDSNIAWHRRQSASSRVDEELMRKSSRALASATDPLEKLRLLCLSRGASGVMALGRIIRRIDNEGSNTLNKEQFLTAIKDSKLDINGEVIEDAEKLFSQFDPDNTGSIKIDEVIEQIRPPMSERRRSMVIRAFQKLDKAGEGVVSIEDLRRAYSVTASPSYLCGEETAELTMQKFLAHFQLEGTENDKVTLEEFMNYYSGISVSIDNDCYFDLMMRQAYKL